MDARSQKNHFERENGIEWFEVIQTEPHFFLLTQEDKRRHCSQGAVIYTSNTKSSSYLQLRVNLKDKLKTPDQ